MSEPDASGAPNRRTLLAGLFAALGLTASYGLFGAYAIAYLFAPRPRIGRARLFVGRRADLAPGGAQPFVDQKGRTLLILADADGLEAFDTRCPHLGCKVHWEPDKKRFLCPCHNGVFDHRGVAIAGPPGDAGQALTRVALDIEAASGNVFVKADD